MGQRHPGGKSEARVPGDRRPYDWNKPIGDLLSAIQTSRPKTQPRPSNPALLKTSTAGFSLLDQIDCVSREVSFREKTYPNQIVVGRLTEAEAAKRIGRMRAALETLVKVQASDG